MEIKSVLPDYQNIINDSELSSLEGLTTARIENLSDGVFSIVMTLLVLDLKLPPSLKLDNMPMIINTIGPQFLSYFLSFIILGSLWVSHHNQFHWITISNRKFLWINIFFLCFISLIPFATTLLRAHEFEPLAIIIYGSNILICLALLYINWVYATHKHRLVIPSLSIRTIHIIQMRILIVIGLYAAGLAMSFIAPIISLITFIVVQILFIVPARYVLSIASKMKE
jgi:uncharacterized membrane protein